MTEDWTDADEIAVAVASWSRIDPQWAVGEFITRVMNYEPDAEQFTTPETRADWGDFTEIREMLEGLGFGSVAHRPVADVAYINLYRGVEAGAIFRDVESNPRRAEAALTLVWRPEHGRWLIHCIGNVYPEPEALEWVRTSPGVGPH